MKRYLVVGDSYALYDERHGHWVRTWAERQGMTTEHFGIPGGNHVNIVNKVMCSNVDYSDVVGVFYFSTDMLRGERLINDRNLKNKSFASSIVASMHSLIFQDNAMTRAFWKYGYSGATIKANNLDLSGVDEASFEIPYLDNVSRTLTHDIEGNLDFFTTTSLGWTVRANYNSMLLYLMDIDARNIPVCIVHTAWAQENHRQGLQHQPRWDWDDYGERDPFVPRQIHEKTDSTNHVGSDYHERMIKEFEKHREKINIFNSRGQPCQKNL